MAPRQLELRILPASSVEEGTQVLLVVTPPASPDPDFVNFCEWGVTGGRIVSTRRSNRGLEAQWDTEGVAAGTYTVTARVTQISGTDWNDDRRLTEEEIQNARWLSIEGDLTITARSSSARDNVGVTLRRSASEPTQDIPLWVTIRRSSDALSFDNYSDKMRLLLCNPAEEPALDPTASKFARLRRRRFLPYNDTDAYRLLKVATEAFVMVNCGVTLPGFPFDTDFTRGDAADATRRLNRPVTLNDLNSWWDGYLRRVNGSSDRTLPYLALVRAKLADQGLKSSIFAAEDDGIDLPEDCVGILREKMRCPCLLELIWSYWHEEGMLVQTLGAITRRFQNVRGPGEIDPLANQEIDPLRPLNNLIWGHIQDEQHRLGLQRRSHEYDHHYGLRLEGRALPPMRAADSRTKFLESFHNLLYLCAIFFDRDDDTTVIADGFPVLNALKDVHLILSEGAHNQFGDLPSTARIEMLMQQWMLARPEFREYLPTRIMVAYPEPWMDRVDAMKSLQGWTDVSVLHFHNLGTFGESLLLSIRYGAWAGINDPAFAANWARFWRAEIQGYIHGYRAVTGVDLVSEVTDPRQAAARNMLPAVHLRNRLLLQRRGRVGIEAGSPGDDYGMVSDGRRPTPTMLPRRRQ